MPQHVIIVKEEVNNFPDYRWLAECTCGFQARVSTELLAEQQGDNHLNIRGIKSEPSKKEVSSSPPLHGATAGAFTPSTEVVTPSKPKSDFTGKLAGSS